MEEILASIRRIIADDDATKNASPPTEAAKPVKMSVAAPAKPSPAPAKAAPSPAAVSAPSAPAASAMNSQDDIDALFATFDAEPAALEPEPEPPPSPSPLRDVHAAPPPSASPSPPRAAHAPPPRPADVLDLTEEMRTPSPPPPTFRKVEAQPDVVFTDNAEEADPDPEPPPPRHRYPSDKPGAEKVRARMPEPSFDEPAEHPQLLSSSTKAAVDSAFNALAQTVLVQNARTLEDLVREMLRPMLKAWLDENLPHMVERLVRAEIERVSRDRG